MALNSKLPLENWILSPLALMVNAPGRAPSVAWIVKVQQRAATNNVNSFLMIKSLIRVGHNFLKNYNGTFLLAAAKVLLFFGICK